MRTHYANLRSRTEERLQQYPGVVAAVRALRAIWILGPGRNLLIRYHLRFGKNPPLPRQEQSIFQELDIAAVVQELNLNGVACGLRIPQQHVIDILRFCERAPDRAYDNPHLICETIKRIALDPQVVEVASRYIGTEPILYRTHLFWSFPPSDPEGARRAEQDESFFHYDLGDFRALVMFIYLTDVDELSGAHVVIEGSHRQTTFRKLLTRKLSDDRARRQYSQRISVISGTSGEGFFEDLACYHKRSTDMRNRLMLTVSYMLRRNS